ncbi:MAG: Bicyclomycin resistance protein [Chlamydiia bacterium]|nr:Bicyclomycin resistance protein [Chlamydiia bacterium]MCH9616176.1 Bicyclomycin resistance protein [Chlamydiia bacterium]MCH9629838.1 Bicyclomycin resistance protein [Chlamydiia bacterium]
MTANLKLHLKTFFPALMFIATIGLVTTDIYLPSFPAIANQFVTENSLVQLSFSFYLFTFSLSQLFYGPFSEKHGRKKTALTGIFFSLLGTLVCIFSPNITTLLIGRLLQGVGLGVGPSLYRAILRDAFTGDSLSHAASLLAISAASTMAIAPTLGGYLQSFLGWRYSFVFLFFYTLLGTLMIWNWLPETLKHPNPNATKPKIVYKNFSLLLRSPIFLSYALCGGLASSGILAYFTVSPFIFQDALGLTPVQYGWLSLTIAAGVALGGFFNSAFVKRVGRHRMLVYGVGFMVLGGGSMALFALRFLNTWVIIIPIFFYVAGVGIVAGNCTAGALHHFPKIAGFGGALFGTIQIFSSALTTTIMAAFHDHTQVPLSLVLLLIGIVCYFLQRIGYINHTKAEKQ